MKMRRFLSDHIQYKSSKGTEWLVPVRSQSQIAIFVLLAIMDYMVLIVFVRSINDLLYWLRSQCGDEVLLLTFEWAA